MMDKAVADAFCKLLSAGESLDIMQMLRTTGPSAEQWNEFRDHMEDATEFLIERGVLCAKCRGCAKFDGPRGPVPCTECEGRGRLK